MEVCERFSDESVSQWLSDLAWVSDDAKVRALLVDIFSRRKRRSNVQARMWGRVVQLFWRDGLSKSEIAARFGVGKEDIRRIVKSLRRESKNFFDAYGQPIQRPKEYKPTKPPRIPITADPTNQTSAHWNAVLASYGFYNPDVRAMGKWKGGPIYTFHWPLTQSSEGEWGAYTIGCDFENLAPTRKRAFTEDSTWGYPYGTDDAERYEGFIAHLPTIFADERMGDVDRAVDGEPIARAYLREYTRLETEKYTSAKLFKIIRAIDASPAHTVNHDPLNLAAD